LRHFLQAQIELQEPFGDRVQHRMAARLAVQLDQLDAAAA